jgi:hypothetical protein
MWLGIPRIGWEPHYQTLPSLSVHWNCKITLTMNITTSIHSQRAEARLVGDSNAYRSQCSRRLATLRKRLGRSNPKRYTAHAPLTPENLAQDPRSIQLPSSSDLPTRAYQY